ncbi:MAG TPA: TolC family protein [Bacteroidota bacterium]|nr:TolC family protein [Bacteroidota bacterium]
MKTLILLLVLTMVGTQLRAQSADSLTVEEAIRSVTRTHPLIRKAKESVEAASARVRQSRSAYYPTSDAELTYTRLDPIGEVTFPGLGLFEMYPENNYDEHISLRQTLYDFGKTSASVDLNQTSMNADARTVELVSTDLAFQTIQTFYAILFLRQNLEVQGQEIDALNEHLLITQKKSDAGTATDFDVLTTQVRIAAEQNRRADIENLLQHQELTFRRLLGLPPDAPIRIKGSFDAPPVSMNPDSLLNAAQSQRTEILQSKDQEKLAELGEKVASLQDRPELKLELVYGLKNGIFPDIDVLRGNWVAGVEAKLPIFNGFKTRSEEEEAHAKVLSARDQTLNTARAVELEVQQSISDIRTNVRKIETSTLGLEQARQALEMAKVRYESGVITNLDLIDAQTALAEAELTRLSALHDYIISRYALQRATGENIIPAEE